MKYKLYTADEIIDYAKKTKIGLGLNYDNYLKSMFDGIRESELLIEHGFFFVKDEKDARVLGGPFYNYFGFLRLTVAKDIDKLMTIEESIRDNFRWSMEHFADFKHMAFEPINLDQHLVEPTKECPYRLYVCGNDDFSWTRTLRSEKEARETIWKLCWNCENVNYYEDDEPSEPYVGGIRDGLKEGRFIFTN